MGPDVPNLPLQGPRLYFPQERHACNHVTAIWHHTHNITIYNVCIYVHKNSIIYIHTHVKTVLQVNIPVLWKVWFCGKPCYVNSFVTLKTTHLLCGCNSVQIRLSDCIYVCKHVGQKFPTVIAKFEKPPVPKSKSPMLCGSPTHSHNPPCNPPWNKRQKMYLKVLLEVRIKG